MGAVVCRDGIYEAFMKGPEHVIELFHGYTYSGHPLAAVAGLATLEAYREDGIFERVRELEPYSRIVARLPRSARCRGYPQPRSDGRDRAGPLAGQPGKRGFELMIECYERGLMVGWPRTRSSSRRP